MSTNRNNKSVLAPCPKSKASCKIKTTSKTPTVQNSIQKYDPKSQKSATVSNTRPIPPIVLRTLVHVDLESPVFMKVAQAAYDEHLDALLPCGRCGRKFFPDRIARHELNCNAQPVVRRIQKLAKIQQQQQQDTSLKNKVRGKK